MNNVYLIHPFDYIRHIDDKLMLYVMLRRLKEDIDKLPECESTAAVRTRMEAYAPQVDELWDSWNIPLRYLVSGDTDDLSDLMGEELMEPEDAGYFCAESFAFSADEEDDEPDYADELTDTAEYYLMELAKKALHFAQVATDHAGELLRDCEELSFIFYGDEDDAKQ